MYNILQLAIICTRIAVRNNGLHHDYQVSHFHFNQSYINLGTLQQQFCTLQIHHIYCGFTQKVNKCAHENLKNDLSVLQIAETLFRFLLPWQDCLEVALN